MVSVKSSPAKLRRGAPLRPNNEVGQNPLRVHCVVRPGYSVMFRPLMVTKGAWLIPKPRRLASLCGEWGGCDVFARTPEPKWTEPAIIRAILAFSAQFAGGIVASVPHLEHFVEFPGTETVACLHRKRVSLYLFKRGCHSQVHARRCCWAGSRNNCSNCAF